MLRPDASAQRLSPHRLPRLVRSDVELRARALALADALLCPERVNAALGEALGVKTRATLRALQIVDADALLLRELTSAWHARLDDAEGASALVTLEGPVASWIVGRLLGRDDPATRLPRPLTAVERALLTATLARVLDSLALTPALCLALEPRTREAELRLLASQPRLVLAAFTLEIEGHSGAGYVILPERWLAAAPQPRRAPPRPPWPDLPIRVDLAIAPVLLARMQLARLSSGALLAGPSFDGAPDALTLTLCVGDRPLRRCRLQRRPGSLTREATILDVPASGAAMTQPYSLDDLPVALTVRVARLHLPLDQLSALRAGDVIDLDRPIDDQVVIAAGERDLALAELVDVEGRLGVRVLKLLGRDEAAAR